VPQANLVLVDRPAPGVERLTPNRPEKRNAISNALRAEVLAALRRADSDDDVHDSLTGTRRELPTKPRPCSSDTCVMSNACPEGVSTRKPWR
jgi:hypothetical protein